MLRFSADDTVSQRFSGSTRHPENRFHRSIPKNFSNWMYVTVIFYIRSIFPPTKMPYFTTFSCHFVNYVRKIYQTDLTPIMSDNQCKCFSATWCIQYSLRPAGRCAWTLFPVGDGGLGLDFDIAELVEVAEEEERDWRHQSPLTCCWSSAPLGHLHAFV